MTELKSIKIDGKVFTINTFVDYFGTATIEITNEEDYFITLEIGDEICFGNNKNTRFKFVSFGRTLTVKSVYVLEVNGLELEILSSKRS